MEHNRSVNSIGRRRLISILAGGCGFSLLGSCSGVAAADGLTGDEKDEFEQYLVGVFGEEDPLPVGLTESESEEDKSGFGGIDLSQILSGSSEGFDEDPDPATDETVVGLAFEIDRELAIIDDVGDAAEEVAAVESDFSRQTFRAQHLLALLNERGMVATLGPDDIKAVRQQVQSHTRYLPLVGSFNNVVQAASDVEEDDQQSVRHFYLAVAAFAVEVLFFKFAIGYPLAFRGTNVLATQSTFARLLQRTSPKMHGLILSEVHWALRQGISRASGVIAASTLTFVYDITQELKDEGIQSEIDGLPDEIDIDRDEIADIELFDCSDNQGWAFVYDSILGVSSYTNPVVERADTIVQDACNS
ncbi:hypothetical protein [Natrononativus amylolyticus]|uniref:hypothetical protein n=1 Tax=Natrononativus amylolyticus TaxID=2963434 RepID=UPI0020CF8941|nr:hypothetical protein [Natrononativus amylolyticus]